jgi:hypothetical protein
MRAVEIPEEVIDKMRKGFNAFMAGMVNPHG